MSENADEKYWSLQIHNLRVSRSRGAVRRRVLAANEPTASLSLNLQTGLAAAVVG
jgi:hypothetical protein